jgi:hypothetical protein
MPYKTALRKVAPAVYDLAFRLKHSELVKRLQSSNRIRAVRSAQASNEGYFAVNIKGKMGFGAMLSQLIAVLKYCESENLHPVVRFTNPLYTNRQNGEWDWFVDFFDVLNPLPPDIINKLAFSDIDGQDDYHSDRQDDNLTILEAHRLYTSFCRIKPAAIVNAKSFYDLHFTDNVLGVHFRGTDKKYEAPPVEYEAMEQFIDHAISKIGQKEARDFRIFVATDDAYFLAYLMSGKYSERLLYFECSEISADGRAIHFSPGDNYRKGVEALSTAYLLSRCRWCVKTTSQLSAWSVILNPTLKVFISQKSYAQHYHFPDKQIWEARQPL